MVDLGEYCRMKFLILCVCLCPLLVGVLSDKKHPAKSPAKKAIKPVHNQNAFKKYLYYSPYLHYYYYKECPLIAYFQIITKKIQYGEHSHQCYSTIIRQKCHGSCHYVILHKGHGSGYQGHEIKKCCRPSQYVWKKHHVKFHCGKYGHKHVTWKTKDPWGCYCTYC